MFNSFYCTEVVTVMPKGVLSEFIVEISLWPIITSLLFYDSPYTCAPSPSVHFFPRHALHDGRKWAPPSFPTTPCISLLFSIWRHAKCKWWNEQDGEFAGQWMRGQENSFGTRAAYVLFETVLSSWHETSIKLCSETFLRMSCLFVPLFSDLRSPSTLQRP